MTHNQLKRLSAGEVSGCRVMTGKTLKTVKQRGKGPTSSTDTSAKRKTEGESFSTLYRESTKLEGPLKQLCTNSHSMGNKHKELEVCGMLQGYSLTKITDKGWDSSHDCSAVMEGYRLFRKGRTVMRRSYPQCRDT